MHTKISERKLLAGGLLLLAAFVFLVKATLFNVPVRVSEKGLGLILIGVVLIISAIRILKKSVVKV